MAYEEEDTCMMARSTHTHQLSHRRIPLKPTLQTLHRRISLKPTMYTLKTYFTQTYTLKRYIILQSHLDTWYLLWYLLPSHFCFFNLTHVITHTHTHTHAQPSSYTASAGLSLSQTCVDHPPSVRDGRPVTAPERKHYGSEAAEGVLPVSVCVSVCVCVYARRTTR
jgi:hypothetical protein